MVLFGSLLDQFVSSFDRGNGLSKFQFDAVRFIYFSAKDFDVGGDHASPPKSDSSPATLEMSKMHA